MRRRKNIEDLEGQTVNPRSESRAGSISQQLDMNETGPLRGDEILHHHGLPDPTSRSDGGILPLTPERMEENYHVDMSEDHREGDEESGDEHSSGLQGEDPDFPDSGLPGEMTEKVSKQDPTRRGYRKRAA